MKIIKWFFGISAVYSLVNLFLIYKRKGIKGFKEQQAKINSRFSGDTPKSVKVLVSASTWIGGILAGGMRWPSDLFCVIGGSIIALPLTIFNCRKPTEEGGTT